MSSSYTNIIVKPSGQACGAEVTNLDLTQPLDDATIADIRKAWLEHHVLYFPDQAMSDTDLERFTLCFGPYSEDPFVQPIDGHEHIIAIQRNADETASIFADVWHTDWSFQQQPPAGTCLFGITIPPVGGDTHFINQNQVLTQMPAELRAKLEGKMAVHSAVAGYSPEGLYGDADTDKTRSMKVVVSDEAYATQTHPIITVHPESGIESIYGCFGYIIDVENMDKDDSMTLLGELYEWQTRPEFQYCHKWQKNTLIMWDNRTVLHKANGGYDGHDRLLHRTTIGNR
jgi:taurine dioxygenase